MDDVCRLETIATRVEFHHDLQSLLSTDIQVNVIMKAVRSSATLYVAVSSTPYADPLRVDIKLTNNTNVTDLKTLFLDEMGPGVGLSEGDIALWKVCLLLNICLNSVC